MFNQCEVGLAQPAQLFRYFVVARASAVGASIGVVVVTLGGLDRRGAALMLTKRQAVLGIRKKAAPLRCVAHFVVAV